MIIRSVTAADAIAVAELSLGRLGACPVHSNSSLEPSASRRPRTIGICTRSKHRQQAKAFSTLGLLSTRRTLESGRYQRAAESLGASILQPPAPMVAEIDAMIDAEAIRGINTSESLTLLQDAVNSLAAAGADAVILGCTDLVLFGASNIGAGILPVVDSTTAHAQAAARHALNGTEE
ncbi:hypothetical protein GCM10027414_35330 [Humibacter ginsengiterrae]